MQKRGKKLASFFQSDFSRKNQRGQITIFIIVALVIVGAVAIFFVFRGGGDGGPLFGGGTSASNPDAFLDTCLEDKISEGIEQISLRGGSLVNSLHINFMFEEEGIYRNISYLCYTSDAYMPCKNQEPMLMNHLKEEISNYIYGEVEICFNELVSSIEDQREDVSSQYDGFDVLLSPDRIITKIYAEIVSTKAEETSTFEDFEIVIPNKLYNLASVAQEIVNQEARFCNFDLNGYMLFYPEFWIDEFRTGDSTQIYTVSYVDTQEKFRFAIRGCVIPPGI